MKYSVALSCSYERGCVWELCNTLRLDGILHMGFVGREITLQVKSENLDLVKKRLADIGITNIAIIELRMSGVTLSDPGSGEDEAGNLKVSLIPSVKGEGIKKLAFLGGLAESKLCADISQDIEEILRKAGVTDALYTVELLGGGQEKEYLSATQAATLNALFDSGGLVELS